MDGSLLIAAIFGAGMTGTGLWIARRLKQRASDTHSTGDLSKEIRDVAGALPDAVVLLRPDGTIFFAGAAAYPMFRIPPGESLNGRNVLEWVPPEERARLIQDIQSLLAGHPTVENRYPLLRQNGETFIGEITANPLSARSSLGEQIVAVIRDVTRRSALEQELRESEERFRKIVEALAFPVILSRPSDGGLLYSNQRAQTLLHLDSYPNIENTLGFYADPKERSSLLNELSETGRVQNREVQFRLPDGKPFWGVITIRMTQYGGENVMLTSINDITPYKQAVAKLEDSEARYRRLAENMMDMISQVTMDGILVYSSPSCAQIIGFSPDALQGKSIFDLVHPADLAISLDRFNSLLQGNRTIRAELRCRTAQGGYIWLEVTGSLLLDARGVPSGAILSSRDIQTRKAAEAAEAEQRRLAEALRDTAALVNSSLDLQEVLDRTLRNLAQVVPHQSANIFLLDSQGIISLVARNVPSSDNSSISAREPAIGIHYRKVPGLRMMAELSRPLIIEDTREYADWAALGNNPDGKVLAYLGAPILSKGKALGFLNLDSSTPGYFTVDHAETLQIFANQVGTAIENARLYTEIQSLAVTDELTGVYNRRGFFELGQREVERARRFDRPLSALMLDIDHFKLFNDQYGYSTGDQVLVTVAQRCRDVIRDVDLLGRFGGEEFMLLLAEDTRATASQVAERLRQAIANQPFITSRGEITVTISLGVAQMSAESEDVHQLIDQAGSALQTAKTNGRNRVCVYTPGP